VRVLRLVKPADAGKIQVLFGNDKNPAAGSHRRASSGGIGPSRPENVPRLQLPKEIGETIYNLPHTHIHTYTPHDTYHMLNENITAQARQDEEQA